MNSSEIEHRNQVLRAYFEGRNWDRNGEYVLKRKLVLNSHQLLPHYPYVIEDEWEVEPGRTDKGRGDLVFTDGRGHFAVVEVKWIDTQSSDRVSVTRRGSNRKKRRKVEKQAGDYAEIFSRKYDCVSHIEAYTFTNDQDYPQPLEDIEMPLSL